MTSTILIVGPPDRSYPALPIQKLKELCDESTYLNGTPSGLPGGNGTSYSLTSEGLAILERAKEDFGRAREDCIQTVQSTIIKQCGTPKATDVYDLAAIIEEYLCAIFSEVRMMANYFRGSSQLFNSETSYLDRFDYILRKHLPFTDGRYFAEMESGIY